MFSPFPQTMQRLAKMHGRQQMLQKADALEVVANAGIAVTHDDLPDSLPDLGGDASGPPAANVVVALRGVALDATAPATGDVLIAVDATNAAWAPPAFAVVGTPAAGNVLYFDGTDWVPVGGTPTEGAVLTMTAGVPTWT